MAARYAGVEEPVVVPYTGAEVYCAAVDIGTRQRVVVAFVVVVVVGHVYFRAFESLVEQAYLHAGCPCAAEFVDFVCQLGACVESTV